MNNPILKEHSFDDIVDWLMLSEKRVRHLLEYDHITAVIGFDNTAEYHLSVLRGPNYYGE